MKGRAFVYARGSTDKQHITMKVQAERGQTYWKGCLAPQDVGWGGVFPDKATSSDRPLAERTYGKGLVETLRPGDHVIVTDIDRAWRNFREAVEWMTRWNEQGIIVHVTERGINTSNDVGVLTLAILAWVAEVEKKMIRERTKRAAAHRRKHNGATNQHAGYGYRLEGRKGSRRKVADPQEREVMGLIVQLHDDKKLRFEDIFWHMLRQGVQYRKGGKDKAWSTSRIQRAYRAEKRLRSRAEPPSPDLPSPS